MSSANTHNRPNGVNTHNNSLTGESQLNIKRIQIMAHSEQIPRLLYRPNLGQTSRLHLLPTNNRAVRPHATGTSREECIKQVLPTKTDHHPAVLNLLSAIPNTASKLTLHACPTILTYRRRSLRLCCHYPPRWRDNRGLSSHGRTHPHISLAPDVRQDWNCWSSSSRTRHITIRNDLDDRGRRRRECRANDGRPINNHGFNLHGRGITDHRPTQRLLRWTGSNTIRATLHNHEWWPMKWALKGIPDSNAPIPGTESTEMAGRDSKPSQENP